MHRTAKEWSWTTIGRKEPYPKFLELFNASMQVLQGTVKAFFSGKILSTRTVTAAYTIAPSDFVVRVNAASGAITVTLPPASTSLGQVVVVKKIDSSANAVTVAGTIDGVVNKSTTTQYAHFKLQCNGASWDLL